MKRLAVLIFALPLICLAAEGRAASPDRAPEKSPSAEAAMEGGAEAGAPLAGLDFRLAEPPAMGGPFEPVIDTELRLLAPEDRETGVRLETTDPKQASRIAPREESPPLNHFILRF